MFCKATTDPADWGSLKGKSDQTHKKRLSNHNCFLPSLAVCSVPPLNLPIGLNINGRTDAAVLFRCTLAGTDAWGRSDGACMSDHPLISIVSLLIPVGWTCQNLLILHQLVPALGVFGWSTGYRNQITCQIRCMSQCSIHELCDSLQTGQIFMHIFKRVMVF